MSLQKITYRQRRAAFTLVELLIVIGIIVVLIAIIMPATQMVRQTQRETHCAHNLTQIGKAYQRVIEASDGQLGAAIRADEGSATSTAWVNLLQTYVGNDPDIFHCVEHDDVSGAISYGINNRADLLSAGDKIVMLDYKKTVAKHVGPAAPEGVDWQDIYDDWPSLNAPRHRGRLNVLFRDGRVDSSGPNEINPTNCFYYEKFWKPARAPGLNRQCLNELKEWVTGEIAPPEIEDPPADPTGSGT
jgi:prepilin-type processing-associated H-X9-DG protein